MAYIISNSDFRLQYEVRLSQDANSRAVAELDAFVDQYAKECVRRAIGLVNYNELNTYLTNGLLPAVPEPPVVDPVPMKWRNLVDGCQYERNGNRYVWGGLSTVLVPYVYYHYVKAQNTYLSGAGEVKTKAKNAVSVNITQTLVQTWNHFVNAYQNQIEPSVDLLTFLEDNSEDYEGYCSDWYGYKNQLGL